MAIVRSFGALQAMTDPPPNWATSSGSLNLYDRNLAYAEIYKTQPNVRICVDFLARNVAQCALHAFRRISDTDRARLADHDLIRWIGKPNPSTRRYRLIESLMSDLGIYFEAFWLKVRYVNAEGRDAIGLVRLPPAEMAVEGVLLPTNFAWTVNGRTRDFAPSEIVYFNGYNPCHASRGLSPMETLRRTLAEEAAAGEHREGFWRNAGRIEGVVTRPKEKPRYTEPQAKQWRDNWQAAHAGGAAAGKTALLQDGEVFTPTSFSARESEYTLSSKLRREVCAAAYHIPQPMVGILDHATFSNIKEQHKHLYQDTLAPWFEMITEEIEGQLLIECDDQRDVYTEFNIAEKLKGSFEEQAAALQSLIGRPIMTANEGRARINLPSITDDPSADRLAAQQGGPATNGQPAQDQPAGIRTDQATADDGTALLVDQVLHAARARQQARLNKLPASERVSTFFTDIERWNRELAEDLTPIVGAEAMRRALDANVATLTELAAEDA